MKSFLQYVAEDIIGKHGTDLSRIAVVFPNKRASLFLSDHLARLSERPIWSPAYMTISDMFRKYSDRQVADPIKQVCDLHKCFVEQTGTSETLDHFYGWGQILLADFDDIDKNMADADRVFANVRDLHELDDVSYLSQEQKEVIRRFFGNFSDEHNSELKERFLRLWSRMSDIYHAFNERLASQGLAYEGALYREVAERQTLDFEYDTYIFVGFNMVQQVEQRLFKMLQQLGKARFYWDFDRYYCFSRREERGASSENSSVDKGNLVPRSSFLLPRTLESNEAGHYISMYLADFPNELNNDDEVYNQFSAPKTISYVSAPTENIQARYASQWLQDNDRAKAGRRTAVVLCNESLLQTVIHCLPDEVEKVNITTGYPLIQSPFASLVSLLLALQLNGYVSTRKRFRLHQVNAVLRHPYIAYYTSLAEQLYQKLNQQKIYYPDCAQLAVDEATGYLFTPHGDNAGLLSWLCELLQTIARRAETKDPLFQESAFRMYTLLNRLLTLVAGGDLQVDTVTLERLIRQLIASTSVPFHGEPAEGLQVMGVLETRNLDFDHLLMLSCNEGNMPKGINDNSFIPYTIRKAYGLTTIDHKVSIYAYYFHRLLSRAKDITIVYNNATSDGQTGEMSRFMLQLMVESPHKIKFLTLQAGQHFTPFNPPTEHKSERVMELLRQRFEKKDDIRPMLSPTAINRYLRCQLLFYYIYVCNLREPDINDDDIIDNRLFGNIFHEAARIIYSRLADGGRQILATDIDGILKSKTDIPMAVDKAIQHELFHITTPPQGFHMELNGLQLINREVIIRYVRQLLELDRRLTPFSIVGLECDVIGDLSIKNEALALTTTIGGRIDRIDRVAGSNGECLRVIDYKTGSSRMTALADVDDVFRQESIARHSNYYLQAMLYSSMVRKSMKYNRSSLPVSPALLFIQHAGGESYDPVLCFGKERIGDVADYSQHFSTLLMQTIHEIFNPQIPFTPTADRQRCTYCPYKLLCG